MKHSKAVGGLVLLAVALLPGLVLTAFGQSDLAGVTALATVAGTVTALIAGMRPAIVMALILGPASALGVAWADSPWLSALLMGVLAGAAALTVRRYPVGAMTMAPISVVFLIVAPPVHASGTPIPPMEVLLVAGLSALWTAALTGLVTRKLTRTPTSLSWSRAGGYAAMVAVAVAVMMWVVVRFGQGHTGGWAVMTIIIVVQPFVQDAFDRTVQRAGGTVVGFGLALVLSVIPWPAVLYVVGTALIVTALALRVRGAAYWKFAALLTPAVVLLEGASTSVADTAVERLLATLCGAAIALLLEMALAPFYRRSARIHHLDRY